MSVQDLKPRGAKPPMSLLPYRALRAVVGALHDGAAKYGLHNWREQTSEADWRQTYQDALLRHALDYADPKTSDYAEDSTIHHVAHMVACGLIILELSGEDYRESPAVVEAKKTDPHGFRRLDDVGDEYEVDL